MGVGDLVSIIVEATERVKSIGSRYLGKAYTATMVSALSIECNEALEIYNQILRDDLGLELYLDGGANTDDFRSVCGFLGVRRVVSKRIGVEKSLKERE